MEIDIRYQTEGQVTSIRFGDESEDIITCNYDKTMVNIAESISGTVYIKDIDNLILALQKAKELWS